MVGAVCGAVNGFVVSVLRVPSLVVTLGMLYVIRGIDGVIVNGDRIDPDVIPTSFSQVGYQQPVRHPVAGHHRRHHRGHRRLRDAVLPGQS